MGYTQHGLLSHFQELSIPMFKNKTQIVGIEVYFTSSLIRKFARSKVAKVVDSSLAQVSLRGEIESVIFKSSGFSDTREQHLLSDEKISTSKTLASTYDVIIHVRLKLIQRKDGKVLWEEDFREESSYQAPQIGLEKMNASNPLYNHRVRLEKIKEIAEETMSKAHNLMIEQF